MCSMSDRWTTCRSRIACVTSAARRRSAPDTAGGTLRRPRGTVDVRRDEVKRSPSTTNTVQPTGAETRTALRAMVSKTGCVSVGDWLMARRMSPVAVCRSSASVSSRLRASSSVKQARVLDGDDGLVGEGLEQLDVAVGESTGLSTTYQYDADGLVVAHHRYGQKVPKSDRLDYLGIVVFLIQPDVRYVDHGAFKDRPPGGQPALGAGRKPAACGGPSGWTPIVRGYDVHQFAIEGRQRAVDGVAQARRTLHDCVEDRLDVRRRAGDDLQDLAGSGQIAVARLLLLVQSHVLDGDDGLVGKGLKELDAAGLEPAGRPPRHHDGADGLAVAQHGDGQGRAPATGPGHLPRGLDQAHLRLHVVDLDHGTVEDAATDGEAPRRGRGKAAAD